VLNWQATRTQASQQHQPNEVAVVPRAARTRRALRAQPPPRPKLPQRLVRRGKGGDLLNPRMSRRRVRPVNRLRSASGGDHQSPSPPLPMTTSAKGAHLTRQPSESGAGPRRTPPEIILIGCIVYVYGTSSAALMRRRLRPRPRRTIPTSCRCCVVPRTVYCCNCLVISISHHSSCTARFRSIRFLVDTVFS